METPRAFGHDGLKATHHPFGSLAKNAQPRYNHKETPGKRKLRDIVQRDGPGDPGGGAVADRRPGRCEEARGGGPGRDPRQEKDVVRVWVARPCPGTHEVDDRRTGVEHTGTLGSLATSL